MSCASPFVFTEGVSVVDTSYDIKFSGSTVIPALTVPSYELCLLGWNPAHLQCVQTKCGPGCVCGWKWCKCCTQECTKWQWDKGSHYWYDCTKIPATTIFPQLTIDAIMTIPMVFELEVGTVITASAPPEPMQCASIELGGFDFSLGINGDKFTIPIDLDITISEENGEFSLSYPLIGINENYSADGFKYQIGLNFSLLFCLTPDEEEGVSWMNIQVSANIKVLTEEGELITTTAFSWDCPIGDVVDE
jgi:hypothetical protein